MESWEMVIVPTLTMDHCAVLLGILSSTTPGKGNLLEFAMGELYPWVNRNYSISTWIPLSCCKLDLLKCTVPRMEDTLLKEGRK